MPEGKKRRAAPPADLTVAEVMHQGNICREKVYAMIRAGELETYLVGRHRRIRAESWEHFRSGREA